MRGTSRNAVAAAAVMTVSVLGAGSSRAAVWNSATGGSWATPGNWTPNTVPNDTGAVAEFTGINSSSRTITVDSGTAGFTVGAISFDTTGAGASSNSVTTGTAGSNLKLNNGGSGVTITASGTGTGNNTISAPLAFNDNVTANVTSTSATSGAGALNLTAAITGTGGFTKTGDGLATFGTGAKTYTGATVLSGGRMRMSSASAPTATSSLTVNAGAQLNLISNNATYTFGSGPLNLNGNGATSGPFSAFPGAIRNDTNLVATIANAVVLQSDATIHVQGAATGSTTLSGNVSGAGMLHAGATVHDNNLGQLVLTGTNSYTGGTTVHSGTLAAGGASTTALGTGNVTVESAHARFAGAIARLVVQAGAVNAIGDNAILNLAGGNAADVADDGFASLLYTGTDTIGGLVLGGTAYTAPGTYGSADSGANFVFNEYFSGPGTVTLVPEPTSLALLGLGGLGLLRRRRA